MAPRSKPWFRMQNNSWYVCMAGEQINLGKDKMRASHQFRKLMARPEPKPQVKSQSVAVILDEFLDWVQAERPKSFHSDAGRIDEWWCRRRSACTVPPTAARRSPTAASRCCMTNSSRQTDQTLGFPRVAPPDSQAVIQRIIETPSTPTTSSRRRRNSSEPVESKPYGFDGNAHGT